MAESQGWGRFWNLRIAEQGGGCWGFVKGRHLEWNWQSQQDGPPPF